VRSGRAAYDRAAPHTWETEMKRALLITSALCLGAPGLALADMSYTDFEISLVDVDVNNGPFDVSGNGFELAGRYGLNDRIFVFGEWQDQNLDFGVDGRELEVGAGLHHGLSSSLDFVAQLSYVDTKLGAGNVSADDNGFALGGGIRARVGHGFEVDAGLRFVDLHDSGSDTGLTLGAHYYFKKTMAIGAMADYSDNADTLRVGFRAEF
jgi:hypothetical protein